MSWLPTMSNTFALQPVGLYALSTSLWTLRFISNNHTAYSDARAVFIAVFILNSNVLLEYISESRLQWHLRGCSAAWPCGLALISWSAWWMFRRGSLVSENLSEQNDLTFLRPCMIPCRTTHSRLFPTKHSFSYSYLYVGIPIGWQGWAGSILSADRDSAKTWFSVAADEYLERGIHARGLSGKLQDYLTSQNVSSDKFPYAYLVTAPRFLGFSFNPVSFWYLYDSKRSLAAMILEVNNTFDERRVYFMERKANSGDLDDIGVKFAQEWPKDFHVSPFNDRGGLYSVQSTDPFRSSVDGLHKIDNNIVLKSDEGKPKIVARVFSTEPAIDATTMTAWDATTFVLRWWWVGFMTNPRILKEARALWAKKLQVYYRPEVLSTSIARNESQEEANLELYFRSFLQQLADTTGISIRYTPASGPKRAKPTLITVANKNDDQNEVPELTVRILTPAFYSQIVRYTTLREAFNQHCLQAADGMAMVQCEQHGMLSGSLTKFSALLPIGTYRGLKWALLDNLRRHKIFSALWKSFLMAFEARGPRRRVNKASEFDSCIRRSSSEAETQLYYRIVLKELLADRIALGWMPILKLEELCLWLLLAIAVASASTDLLRHGGMPSQRPTQFAWTIFKLCLIHVWSYAVS